MTLPTLVQVLKTPSAICFASIRTLLCPNMFLSRNIGINAFIEVTLANQY